MMRRHFPIFILLLALAACAGQAPPPDAFHRIQPAAPTRLAAPLLPGVVEVERLATDAVLAERAITFQPKDDGALLHYNYDYWSEPPGVLVQDRLAAHLAAAGIADRVVTPDLRVLADWTVRGKLRRFEHLTASSSVAVEVQLAVVSARDGTLVLLETYEARIPTLGGGVEAAVAAAEKGVSDIFVRLVADLGRARAKGARP